VAYVKTASGSSVLLFDSKNTMEKVHITSLNFRESPFFLPELQNRAKHIPQLLKPFILPLWPCYKQF
jgi:hypothetical protein